jgi:hypothetical protein
VETPGTAGRPRGWPTQVEGLGMSLNRRESLALIAISTVDLDLSTCRTPHAVGSPGLPLRRAGSLL